MATKVAYDIESCKQCPFFDTERYYSPDSFEAPSFDWYCEKMGHKKICGYVEWHEEDKIKIPEWCPIKVKENVEN